MARAFRRRRIVGVRACLEQLVRQGRHRVVLGRRRRPERGRLVRPSLRNQQPGQRAEHAARDDPHARPAARVTNTPHDRPDRGRHELAPAGDQADAQAGHRRREDHVEAELRRDRRSPAAEQHPGERRHVPRDERGADGGDPVAAFGSARPSRRKWAMRQGERLVRQERGPSRRAGRPAGRAATAPAPPSRAGGGR